MTAPPRPAAVALICLALQSTMVVAWMRSPGVPVTPPLATWPLQRRTPLWRRTGPALSTCVSQPVGVAHADHQQWEADDAEEEAVDVAELLQSFEEAEAWLQESDPEPPKRPNAERGLNVIVNGVMLMVAGFLVAVGFVTVDASIWRGWQPEEIFLRLLPDTWQAYERALLSDPITVKAGITGATYFLGDWVAQAFQLTKCRPEDPLAWLDVNRARLFRGLCIGMPLGVLAHYYYDLNDTMLKEFPVALKIFVDQTAYLAIYNTFYYIGLAVLAGKDLPAARAEYSDKFWTLLTAGWKLWPAVGVITYSVIPLQHRLLWVDFIEILYSAILSTLSNESGEEDEASAVAGGDASSGKGS